MYQVRMSFNQILFYRQTASAGLVTERGKKAAVGDLATAMM
jgi:hypothetical protein